ncbi:MAG TPA: SMC family ATPase [Thermoplasmata archaeon]|nr:SMC family ATPase [Thermoplasmata archaeon]
MKLAYLALENYRKFAKIALEFPDGVTGIIGQNGVGKSTLVEAVCWALYGQSAARTKKELLKRTGASQEEACRVLLQFELNSDQYEVMREMVGKDLTPNAWVKVNGKVLIPSGAKSANELTRFLTQKIGMDRESFYTSLVAKQKELNALSDRTYGERRKLILRMLRIDAIDQAIASIRSDKRDKRRDIEFIKSKLKPVEELKQGLETFKAKERAEENQKLELERRIAKQIGLVDNLKKKRDENQAKYEEFNKLRQIIGILEERETSKTEEEHSKKKEVEELNVAASRLKEIRPKVVEYNACTLEKQKLDEARGKHFEVLQLRASKARALEELERLKSRKKGLERTKEQLEQDLQKYRALKQEEKKRTDELSEIQNSINQKELKKEQLETRNYEIERLKTFLKGPQSQCPTCKRPLGLSYYLVIESYNDAIEENKNTFLGLENELKKLEEKANLLEEARKSIEKEAILLERTPGKLDQLKEEIKPVENESKERESKLAEVSETLKSIGKVEFDELKWKEVGARLLDLQGFQEQWIRLANKVERIGVLEKELREISGELKGLDKTILESKDRLANLGFNEGEYKSISEAFDRNKDELSELEKQKAAVNQRSLQLKNERERLENEIKEQDQLQTQIAHLKKEVRYLDWLAGDREEGLLNEFKSNLIGRIGPALSSYASQLLSQLSRGKYSELEVDENYDIHLIDQGEKYSLDRFSGGETDLANLCLRLAISQVIAERSGDIDFQFIILDEIFGSQDQERKRNILDALSTLTRRFRQIFLITHVDEIKDAMEHVIVVKENEDGTSSASLE